MEEKMTDETMEEKTPEEIVGMTTETGAETLHKLRQTRSEVLYFVASLLYFASLGLVLKYHDDFLNDEVKTPRGYFWFSSAACLVIGTAMWIDIIIASTRYKVVVGDSEFNLIMLLFGIISLVLLILDGSH